MTFLLSVQTEVKKYNPRVHPV